MKIEYINLKDNDIEIPVKIFLPKNTVKKIIIACHGFGGDKESSTIKDLAEEMILKNIAVVSFDFPAHGESKLDGKELTIENCINNINTLYRYSKKFNAPISLFATSFGAYINLINIARNNNEFQEIVLRSPAIEINIIDNGDHRMNSPELRKKVMSYANGIYQ